MKWLKTIFFLLIFYGSVYHSYSQGKLISESPYYTSFDLIHYTAFTGSYTGTISPAYYAVELIDSHGKAWIQQKLKVKDGFISGTLTLQAHIPSGFYWIRAYPALFTRVNDQVLYLPLIILNADDLEEDLWKDHILGDAGLNKIYLVNANRDISGVEQPIKIAVFNENGRIIPGSGYFRGVQTENRGPIKSDNTGLFRLPGALKSYPDVQIAVGLKQGDTLTTSIGKLFNESNGQNPITIYQESEQQKALAGIKIIPEKDRYSPGEIVKIKISGTEANNIINGRMIVMAYDTSQVPGISCPGGLKTFLLKSGNSSENKALSSSAGDTKGFLLKAKYLNPENNKPRANYAVALACLGSKPSLTITSADISGGIIYDISVMPENSSFYISTLGQPLDGFSIEEDYFRSLTERPLISLDQSSLPGLDSFVNVAKIRRILYYQYFEKKQEKPVTSEQLLFDSTNVYGKPDISYNLNDYILFKDLREVIREILPYVYLKNTDKGPKITLINNTNPYLNRNPLFLINGIPTRDVPLVMSLRTQDVQRIDLLYDLNTLRPYGLAGFGGIMAIYTSKPVDIPNVEKINFKGIHNSPAEHISALQPGLLDLSPVVYWNSAAKLVAGTCELQFKLNDLYANIKVEIIGFDSYGQIFNSSVILKVMK